MLDRRGAWYDEFDQYLDMRDVSLMTEGVIKTKTVKVGNFWTVYARTENRLYGMNEELLFKGVEKET